MSNIYDQPLQKIIRFAGQHSPYYRELYTQHGIDLLEIRSVQDLPNLPIVTVDDLTTHWEKFKAETVFAYRVTSSSGTLGNPKTLFRTLSDTRTSVDAFVRLLKMAALREGDRMLIAQPFDLAHLGYLAMEACSHLGIMSIPCGISMSNEQLLNLIAKLKPNVLFSSVSRLADLTHMLIDEGDPLPSVRAILLAGERVSFMHTKFFQEHWGTTPVNLYGSEETDGLGGSCTINEHIHFFNDLFYLELLPLPAPINEEPTAGEAVITSLYAQGTPLIRYRLGDILSIEEYGCACGQEFPLLKVHGRVGDVLQLYDGIKLYGFQVESLLHKILPARIGAYQIQCRMLTPGVIEVSIHVQVDQADNVTSLEQRLVREVWNCSLDLGAAREMGTIRFRFVINKKGMIQTQRGKTPRIIDLRQEIYTT